MITKLATFRGVTGRGDPLVRVFRQGDSVTKVAGTLMQPIQDWLGTYKSDARKIAILVNALGASEFWGCFPAGTPITTSLGLESIEKVKEGDLVLTHQNRLRRVTRTFVRSHEGSLTKVFTAGMPRLFPVVEATPNHEMRVVRRDEMVTKRRQHVYRRGSGSLADAKAALVKDLEFDWVPIGDLQHGDYLLQPFPTEEKVSLGPLLNTSPAAFLMGLYAAEGSVFERVDDGRHPDLTCGVVYVLSNARRELVDKVRDCAKTLGCTAGVKELPEESVFRVTVHSSLLARACRDHIGRRSIYKGLSPAILAMPRGWQRLFFDAWAAGDGCVRPSGKGEGTLRLSTASYGLAHDGRLMAARLGLVGQLEGRHNTKATWYSGRPIFHLNVSGSQFGEEPRVEGYIHPAGFILAPVRKVEESEFSGEVFNLEVEEDNSYTASGVIVHNSNVNGDVFYEPSLIHDCRCHPSEQHPIDDFTGKVIPPYGYWTFLNAYPYAHHRNKDPNRAFGTVEVTCWNPRMKRVELVVLIDRHLAMQHDAQHVVDRIDRGEYADVSMGCRVPYDRCTICNHKSKTRNDYCSCIKNIGMGKILDDGRQIGVINDYPRFFDISFVFIGADKTAKMMCKLGSAGAPQSVIDAERVYHFEETPDGIIKAACGRKSGCAECRGKCKVAEPRISGVSAEESDRILSGLRGAATGAVSGHTPAEVAIRAATGAAKRMGLSKVLGKDPLKVKGVPKRLSQKEEGRMAKKLLKKVSSEQSRFTAEVYSGGTGETTRHKRLTRETQDGQSKTTLERLAPPPPSSQTLYGREDPQDDEGVRVLSTNEDMPTDGVEDDSKLSSVAHGLHVAERLYKLRGHPETLENLDKQLLAMQAAGNWGSSRGIRSSIDGDGHEWLRVEGVPGKLDKETLQKEMDKDEIKVYSLKKEGAYKMGPPPSPNRDKFPFVGTLNFRGLLIYVENAPGTWRTGPGWKTLMKVPYGEFARSLGTDGDKLDVYVGPDKSAENVFVVHQNHVYGPKKGEYDEDKVMLGFRTAAQAKKAYLAHYDSPKFFRSMTTMAFPLFKRALLRKEVDGEKVAYDKDDYPWFKTRKAPAIGAVLGAAGGVALGRKLGLRGFSPQFLAGTAGAATGTLAGRGLDSLRGKDYLYTMPNLGKEDEWGKSKTAESLKLEDLFESASTPDSRRRERTWRDKTTGKETNVTGSGMGSWEKTKTASVRVYGPMDLYKLSTEDKEAAKRKWAEIIKEVGPSKAVGQTSPLLSASEPSIPRSALDAMGAKGLEPALATPSLMGMVLKPREFQRISLVSMGKKDLADQLDDAGACFRPRMGEEGPCSCLEPHHADMDILRMLLPLLSQRSYYGPVVRRRIIRITMVKPEPPAPEQEVDSPLLSKVASAYNWYRREQMKVAASSVEKVTTIPELHAGIYGLEDGDLFKTAAMPDRATTGLMLGAVPLTLMYSAHLRSAQEKGENLSTLGRFVADHPWLTSLAAMSGARALMETPEARRKIDEGIRRAVGAAGALRGH